MKSHCAFCGESWGDENLHTCSQCHADYCFRDDCKETHDIRCDDLAERYETIYEIQRGTYGLDVEPREWYDEVRAGSPFRCLYCEKSLHVERLVYMGFMMALEGYYLLKHLLCSRGYFQERLSFGNLMLRGFCPHCHSLLEFRKWQSIVRYEVTPRSIWRRLGGKRRFDVKGGEAT